jgi:hypothetical protein
MVTTSAISGRYLAEVRAGEWSMVGVEAMVRLAVLELRAYRPYLSDATGWIPDFHDDYTVADALGG